MKQKVLAILASVLFAFSFLTAPVSAAALPVVEIYDQSVVSDFNPLEVTPNFNGGLSQTNPVYSFAFGTNLSIPAYNVSMSGIAGDSFYAWVSTQLDGAGSILSVPTDPAWILDDPSDLFTVQVTGQTYPFFFFNMVWTGASGGVISNGGTLPVTLLFTPVNNPWIPSTSGGSGSGGGGNPPSGSVPEPGWLVLLALGLLGMGYIQSRQKKVSEVLVKKSP